MESSAPVPVVQGRQRADPQIRARSDSPSNRAADVKPARSYKRVAAPREGETGGTMASSRSTSSPPYPSAARISDSPCFPQYTASIKCLEANQDKSKCQQQFDDYKECKKKEREARLERNRKKSFF